MTGIRLDGLGKDYGPVAAVRDVALSIAPGEFVTLLGPSGSGKTTTLRMIAGLERPDHGSIAIGERVVSAPGSFVPTHRRNLGMVFQSYAVWPHKSVHDNVAFPLDQRGVSREDQRRRVREVLDLVGLGELGGRYPSQLSGGQQQRVSLARALVAEPEVLLFDEPLSNLDAQLRESMRALIRDVHRRLGITAVYVTHDQIEAMVLSDRVFVMNQGRLVQGGTPEELYDRPASVFVAEFVGSANLLRLEGLDHSTGMVRVAGGAALRVAHIPERMTEQVLVVRPHAVTFVDDTTPNVIEGQVRSRMFLGDRLRYHIEAPGGLAIMLDAVAGGPRHEEGATVRVALPPDACVVL
ncbi:MAG: ABC transporter ATP-binding protein [Variibacter sp.]|nr:ABC transporter ATP-binding protein [Variibacter sp.]